MASDAERVAEHRRRYAEDLRERSQLRTEALVAAFASVPREHFLGPGPWKLLLPGSGTLEYSDSPDDDPVHLYQNALVAIDPERRLNNGEPAGLARWFDALELRPEARVLHVGAGVGYYTAVLAETVGPDGQVLGIEADPELAARADRNLRGYPNCAVAAGDGSAMAPGPRDAIFVNAGATRVVDAWLDALAPEGRLLVPLTVRFPGMQGGVGGGHILLVVRRAAGYEARFVSPVGVFHCEGARSDGENDALRDAYTRGGETDVASLRRDAHEPDEECWLHGAGFCLSRRGIAI